MESSVNLQEPMSMLRIWIIIAAILFVAAVLLQIIFRVRRRRQGQVPGRIKVVKPPKASIPEIKNKYLNQLEGIRQSLGAGEIDRRIAYQRMSGTIRHFVFDMTGISVQKYTLAEIRQVRMPALTKLIEEYYGPEFSTMTIADAEKSIEETRRVIEKWH